MFDLSKPRFSPSLCLTHNCNLDCVYCYQKHDANCRMSFDTARKCIDWIFKNIPEGMSGVEIGFIGGEPLLEFPLIVKIYEYTHSITTNTNFIFYATTNGTVLTDEMKDWFSSHRDNIVLGLSLDGLPETHNANRSNSYSRIDFRFFADTWPYQGVKMTLSEKSLENLADNIIHAHELGFVEVGGVNLFEGTFNWEREEYVRMLIPQLKKLVDYYVEHDDYKLDQMMDRHLELCESKSTTKRWCGIGTGTIFFDVDGTRYPCPFVTPMTFDSETLCEIEKHDFDDLDGFVDDYCATQCYIYPTCPHCAGANYLTQRTFKTRDKSKCRIQKLIALFVADLQARRLLKHPERYDEAIKYNLITSIQKVRENYLHEFDEYLGSDS